jgi:hypothetical protein
MNRLDLECAVSTDDRGAPCEDQLESTRYVDSVGPPVVGCSGSIEGVCWPRDACSGPVLWSAASLSVIVGLGEAEPLARLASGATIGA